MILEKLSTMGLVAAAKSLGFMGLLAPAAALRVDGNGRATAARVVGQSVTAADSADEAADVVARWSEINSAIAEALAGSARMEAHHHRAAAELDEIAREMRQISDMLAHEPA